MSYKEEIFSRLERSNFGSSRDVLDWLIRDKNGNVVRRKSGGLRRLSEDLFEPFEIERDANRTLDVDELIELRRRASGLSFGSDQALKAVQTNLREAVDVQEQEMAIAEQVAREQLAYNEQLAEVEELTVEEQKTLYKQGTREERELAAVALGESSPKVFGGIKSGESRAARRALRQVFE